MPSQEEASAPGDPRVCVYTTLLGGYERLNAQPMARQSGIAFICLTDDDTLSSSDWTIRLIEPIFPLDPIRSQRDLKLRPHVHLPDFDVSLYVDNSVILTAPPEEILRRLGTGASGLSAPLHDMRETVLDEFLEVARLGLDDQTRIFEQLNHYQMTDATVLAERPFWAAILLRDHRNAELVRMLEIWAAHVHRYSRRDQLSFNMACRLAGFTPDAMQLDAAQSWFHRWPAAEGRDRTKGTRALQVSLSPPMARLRALELELAREKASHAQTLTAMQSAQAKLAMWTPAVGTPPAPARATLLRDLIRRMRMPGSSGQ